MMRISAIALAAMLATAADAVAQTSSDRQACKPDVFRLCSAGEIAAAALGDRAGIYACFRAHRSEVSPACDRVLKNHGY